MKKRQHSIHEQNDLEYLSELAFSEIKVSEQEIHALRHHLRRRIQHLSILSVILVLMIAFLTVVFLCVNETSDSKKPASSLSVQHNNPKSVEFRSQAGEDLNTEHGSLKGMRESNQ